MSILRLIEEEAIKDNTSQIHAQVPVSVATYLMNEKRDSVRRIESRLGIRIYIIPNEHMETPHYEVTRIRIDEEIEESSYNMVKVPAVQNALYHPVSDAVKEKPAIAAIAMQETTPAAAPVAAKAVAAPQVETSIIAKVSGFFKSLFAPAPAVVEEKVEQPQRRVNNRDNKNRRNGRNNNQPRRHEGDEKTPVRDDAKPARNSDRPARSERPERNDRNERNERPARTERPEKADRQDRGERPERTERLDRHEKKPQAEKPAKVQVEAEEELVSSSKVVERRQRRNMRKSVRLEKAVATEVNADIAEVAAIDVTTDIVATVAAVEPVATTVEVAATETQELQPTADADKDEGENRSRSRRSPRHLRAAGQKRKKEQTAGDTDDAVDARYPLEENTEVTEHQLDLPIAAVSETTVETIAEAIAVPAETTQVVVEADDVAVESAVVAPATVEVTPVQTVTAETTEINDTAEPSVKPRSRSRAKATTAKAQSPEASADGVTEPVVIAEAPAEVVVAAVASAPVVVDVIAEAAAPAAVEVEAVVTEAVISAPVVAEVVVAEAAVAPVATPVKAKPVARGNRYGNMVTSDMTKPVAAASADETVEVPVAMAAADRPVVVSSSRTTNANRQISTAPMTKPKSVDE